MEKILVIDDDAPFRSLICTALRDKGYEVLEAANGEEGIERAQRLLPDLILSDVHMGRVDGYDVLKMLDGTPQTAAIPLILMTGMADAQSQRESMELGADDYLAKPFTLQSLYATVGARLRRQTAVKRLAEQRLADLRSSISMLLPHELNTPLMGILGIGDLLADDADGIQPGELREMGVDLVTSANRLRRVIGNFLLHARIELLEANPQELAALRRQSTPITSFVVAEAARKEAARAARQTDLALNLAESSAAVSSQFLAKIVEELVSNAFKFSLAGTPVEVTLLAQGAEFVLGVRDEGRGMKPEQVGAVGAYVQFERRLHEQQGTGLGLFLSMRLAEVHGGRLSIESLPGVGTTVTVRLPAGEAEDAKADA